MRKNFKYRISGNKETIEKSSHWLVLCQQLYNIALEQRILIYKQGKQTISDYSQKRQLPEIKTTFTEYQGISSQTLQDVIERLNRSYDSFFRRIKNGEKPGFPRFKSINRYNSFTLKQAGWKMNGKYLSIRNIGRFKLRLSRPIQGNIKTITISRQSDKWYACFSCDNVPENRLTKSHKAIGIDVGIKSFCVDSDNNMIDNPKFFRQSEKLVRRRQRKLSRCKRGSNRRLKARILVAKSYEKVSNQRNDFLHKTSGKYIKQYGFIAIEDLNIKGMVKNHHLAKSINDSAWGKFFELLSYKAEEAGRTVVKVPRFEPTSKTCSECGAIYQELKLSDRTWVCKSCGILHDRDFNAAKNILKVGQTLQSVTCGNSQSVDCESLKSECQYETVNLQKT